VPVAAQNPEELFAVGYAACFETALGGVARRRHVEVGEVTIDSAVSLLPTGDGGFKLAVTLDVLLPSLDNRELAADLVRGAHQVCPYSNATRGRHRLERALGDEADKAAGRMNHPLLDQLEQRTAELAADN
jgi:Ohr subfamily peroxiredoxin